MAKYNREFLVPYLQDICSLYLADRKLLQRIRREESKITECRKETRVHQPDYPSYLNTEIGCLGQASIVWTLIYLCCFVGSFFFEAPFSLRVVLFIGFAIGAVIWACSVEGVQNAEKVNIQRKIQYQKEMEEYSQKVRAETNEKCKNLESITESQNTIAQISVERKRIHKLLDFTYSANIIPSHYRNIYASVFLYDWFSTSGADDLDMALNMFVLEEIKAKLDHIIEQQADVILNQRIMMANQEKSLENQREFMDQQNDHNGMLQRKLDQLQATEDERLRYEIMAESNTAATAYFAWANYLK